MDGLSSSGLCEPSLKLHILRCLERSNCFSAPCLNAGTCIEEPGGYKCNCKYHYSGINCQGSYRTDGSILVEIMSVR